MKNTAVEFGKGLKSQWGFKKGDVLGFFSPNSIDYALVFFGVLWAGGACSTANPNYTTKELAFQMKDSKVAGIVTQAAMLPAVLEAAKVIGLPEDRIILLGDERDPKGKFKHFTEIRYSSVLGIPSLRPRIDPKKDLSFLVYSSGTTGLPKGVMLTHSNIVSNLMQLEHMEKLNGLYHSGGPDGKGDRQIAILPFFHIYVSHRCILVRILRKTNIILRDSLASLYKPYIWESRPSYCPNSTSTSSVRQSRTMA